MRIVRNTFLGIIAGSLSVFVAAVHADGPADNIPDQVRRIPPPGIAVPDEVRKRLLAGLDELDLDHLDTYPAITWILKEYRNGVLETEQD